MTLSMIALRTITFIIMITFIMTHIIMPVPKMTLRIMTISIKALSRMTFNKMTLCITILFKMTHIIMPVIIKTQMLTQSALSHSANWHSEY